jgi:hypothetical protein
MPYGKKDPYRKQQQQQPLRQRQQQQALAQFERDRDAELSTIPPSTSSWYDEIAFARWQSKKKKAKSCGSSKTGYTIHKVSSNSGSNRLYPALVLSPYSVGPVPRRQWREMHDAVGPGLWFASFA